MTALRYKLLCWLLRKDLNLEIKIGANLKCYHYDNYIFEVRIKEKRNVNTLTHRAFQRRDRNHL